jgi:Flp pilus assembly pilin Flp
MKNSKKLSRRSGQTMVEYIIIVVLIAIAAMAVVGKFGKGIMNKFSGATNAIDEDAGSEAKGAIKDVESIKQLDADGNFN